MQLFKVLAYSILCFTQKLLVLPSLLRGMALIIKCVLCNRELVNLNGKKQEVAISMLNVFFLQICITNRQLIRKAES